MNVVTDRVASSTRAQTADTPATRRLGDLAREAVGGVIAVSGFAAALCALAAVAWATGHPRAVTPWLELGVAVTPLLLFVAGMLWLDWFQAAYAALGERGGGRHPEWTFWGWVLPLANLVLPKRLVDDLWHAPDEPGAGSGPPWQVRAWWVLWLAFTLLASATWRGREVPNLAQVALLPVTGWFAVRTIRLLTSRVVAAYSAGVEPPSTGITQPVTYDAAGDSTNAATRPNSAGSP